MVRFQAVTGNHWKLCSLPALSNNVSTLVTNIANFVVRSVLRESLGMRLGQC